MWQTEPKIISRLGKQHVFYLLSNYAAYFLILIVFYEGGIPFSICVSFCFSKVCIWFSKVFDLDIILSYLWTFWGHCRKEDQYLNSCKDECVCLPLGGEQTQFCGSWRRQEGAKVDGESTLCGPWGLPFLHMLYAIM